MNPKLRKKMKAFVLDSSAFMHGFLPALMEGVHFTPPAVLDELKSIQAKASADAALLSKSVEVLPPPEEYLKEVSRKAVQLGDLHDLSRADLEVLALALYLKESWSAEVVVVSDDYDVQNVAAALNLALQPLRTHGITAVFKWVYYCSSCGKVYRTLPPSRSCEVCGSPLKRKPRRKTRLSS